jgi:hypothetical protein
MDDKHRRNFNFTALKEAVGRMEPELDAACEAAHKYAEGDTEDDKNFDRAVAVGFLVESLEALCGPQIWVLVEIAHSFGAEDTHKGTHIHN